MNLKQMRTFLEVAKRGSLTRAARVLQVSQPAVTQQIQRLESELGGALFERAGDELVLTEAGKRLRRLSEYVLEEYDALKAETAKERSLARGQLRVGASTIPGEFVLPRVAALFKSAHPGVEISVMITDSADVIHHLAEGDIDVGFVGAHITAPNLVVSKLIEDEIVLIVPMGHAFSQRLSIHFGELDGQPLILRERGSGTMQSLEHILTERGLELPRRNVVMELGSTRAVISAVASGLGIGFVSRMALEAESEGRVVSIAIEGLVLKRSLYYVYRKNRTHNALVDSFISFLDRWSSENSKSNA